VKVAFRSSFLRDVKNVRDAPMKRRIIGAIEQIEAARRLDQIAGLTSITGESGAYRIRVGDYRLGLISTATPRLLSAACIAARSTATFREMWIAASRLRLTCSGARRVAWPGASPDYAEREGVFDLAFMLGKRDAKRDAMPPVATRRGATCLLDRRVAYRRASRGDSESAMAHATRRH